MPYDRSCLADYADLWDICVSTLSPRHRRRLKNSYFQALEAARIEWVLRRVHSRDGVALILNFHRVSPVTNPYWPALTPEAFSTLVRYLASACQVVTVAELASGSRSTPAPRVVLSFDDGCQDFTEYAMPILESHGLRVNHNVIVECVESGRPPWIIRVVDALNAASTSRVRALTIPGFSVRLKGDDEAAKTRYGTELTAHLKSLVPAERAEICADVNALIEETDPAHFTPMMTPSEVETLAETHELGSHSYSHEAMQRLSDAEFETDLNRCTAFFARLRRPMTIFAFPYGSFRFGQIERVRARGVEHVLLVGERPTALGTGVYTRITMYGDSDAELRLRAMGHRWGLVRRVGG